ncbi:hypothetical protein OV079_51375 [Nannocystis pusilla]|uniref:Uncharacterized protein n=1 Tax=Nannocystis pusilla TaxID=889268 RepID=A0A9X3F3I8_9BACT|nr:hypothetical protein [Nannocystis pusilla]MCY1013794.1 hypothetical protein [Nannocystis pusilla]
MRRGILQVWTGRDAFRKLILEHGVPRTVGTADADFVVHADASGSPCSRSCGTGSRPRARPRPAADHHRRDARWYGDWPIAAG